MEAGLQQCASRLEQQLTILDARVQALEKSTAGKICIERSAWEELENRVLLLETGLTLTQAQVQRKYPQRYIFFVLCYSVCKMF